MAKIRLYEEQYQRLVRQVLSESKNPIFGRELNKVILDAIQSIYGSTEYWGKRIDENCETKDGIKRAVTTNDDGYWSSLNFVNTNRLAHKRMFELIVRDYGDTYQELEGRTFTSIEYNKSAREHATNQIFLDIIRDNKEEFFGLNGSYLNEIIDIIQTTRYKGRKAEEYLVVSLEQSGYDVDLVACDGGLEDFRGIDAKINGKTAQIKSGKLLKSTNMPKYFVIPNGNASKVSQDYLIIVDMGSTDGKFENGELKFYIFRNSTSEKYNQPTILFPHHPLYKYLVEKANKNLMKGYYIPKEDFVGGYKAKVKNGVIGNIAFDPQDEKQKYPKLYEVLDVVREQGGEPAPEQQSVEKHSFGTVKGPANPSGDPAKVWVGQKGWEGIIRGPGNPVP